ncbi:MAG: hypothetical protein P8047_05735 [Gammaproteobacteria bacterium]
MLTASIWLGFAYVLGLFMRLLGLPPLVLKSYSVRSSIWCWSPD